MTCDQARSILRDVSYKGWVFVLLADSTYHTYPSVENAYEYPVTLQITFPVICTGTGKPINLTFSTGFHLQMIETEQMFLTVLFDMIMKAEKHEAEEQFKFKGVMLYDPHKEERERYKRVHEFGLLNRARTAGS